jgi:formylglycine-generating enzyme required for sulfatase activity
MGPNPSIFQGDKVTDDADRHPVENVTWDDAQAFVRRLNQMEKTTAYRLPTEFEWEWASRAGSEDALPTPGEGTNKSVMYRQGGTTAMVGTMHANAWGLYDMLGNVWEWAQDYYDDGVMPDAGRHYAAASTCSRAEASCPTSRTSCPPCTRADLAMDSRTGFES